MEQESNNVDARELLIIFFKHKHKFLTVFFSTVIIVIVGSFLFPAMYKAESSLMIKMGREYVYRPEVGDTGSTVTFGQEEIINSEIQILTSHSLMEKVITSFEVENIYPELINKHSEEISPVKASVIEFEKKISVDRVEKSNVINISFRHRDPQIAARAVNLLIEFYKDKRLLIHGGSKSSFLEKQVQFHRRKLKESEDKLEAFKQKNRIFSLDEQKSLLLQQRMNIDTQLKTNQNQIKGWEKKLSSLREQMHIISENVPLYTETERHKIIDDGKAELMRLRLREQELLGKYKESSRFVVNVRKEIQMLKDFMEEQEENLKARVRTGKNVVYQGMELDRIKITSDLSSINANIDSLTKQLNEVNNEIKKLDLKGNELQSLKREVATNETNFKKYLVKAEEARILEDMDRQKMANISVIQEATVPSNPTNLGMGVKVIFGIILGSLFGLGFAIFSEYISQGISTPEKVTKLLNTPVLVSIPIKKG